MISPVESLNDDFRLPLTATVAVTPSRAALPPNMRTSPPMTPSIAKVVFSRVLTSACIAGAAIATIATSAGQARFLFIRASLQNPTVPSGYSNEPAVDRAASGKKSHDCTSDSGNPRHGVARLARGSGRSRLGGHGYRRH